MATWGENHSSVAGATAPLFIGLLAIVVTGACWVGIADSLGQEPGRPGGRTKVIVIGINEYQTVPALEFCVNDAKLVARTMRGRADCRDDDILVMTDDSEPSTLPTRRNILERTLPLFLGRMGPQDRLIFHFSGHGLRDNDGRVYLAPIDCDASRLESSCVPLPELHALLRRCAAGEKLLLLDCCHAGSAKSIIRRRLSTDDLGHDLHGIYTLASSRAEEESVELRSKRHGLFTFWVNVGLEGGADRDGDGVITADELYDFVQGAVRMTKLQAPVRIVGPDVVGVPTVVQLKPEKIEDTLRRVATIVHEIAESRRAQQVGVVEFTNLDLARRQSGLSVFGRTTAERLQEHLANWPNRHYAVADNDAIQVALGQEDFRINSLADPQKLARLGNHLPKLDLLLTGTFRTLSEQRAILHCKLVRPSDGSLSGTVTGIITHYVGQPPKPEVTPNAGAVPTQLRPDAPFAISLCSASGRPLTVYRPRDGRNELVVGAMPNAEYQIRIANRTDREICVRLFIDRLNVLGVHADLPDQAKFWRFPAKSELTLDRWHQERTEKTTQRQIYIGDKFLFVAPGESFAARQGLSEEHIGQITALFYTSRPKSAMRETWQSDPKYAFLDPDRRAVFKELPNAAAPAAPGSAAPPPAPPASTDSPSRTPPQAAYRTDASEPAKAPAQLGTGGKKDTGAAQYGVFADLREPGELLEVMVLRYLNDALLRQSPEMMAVR